MQGYKAVEKEKQVWCFMEKQHCFKNTGAAVKLLLKDVIKLVASLI